MVVPLKIGLLPLQHKQAAVCAQGSDAAAAAVLVLLLGAYSQGL